MPIWAVFFGLGVAVVLLGAPWVWYQRRESRDPRSLVYSTTRGAESVTVVRATDTHVLGRLALASITLCFIAGGIEAVTSSAGGSVILFLLAAYFGYAVWLYQTGRVGDGSVWLTRQGIRQCTQGFEHGVKWDDLEAVTPSHTGAFLDAGGHITSRRRAPRFWTGKGPEPAGELAIPLQLGNIHQNLRVPLMRAIEDWSRDEQARSEIGTDEASRRILDRLSAD